MSERSSTPSSELTALTLGPVMDELPFDVLVNVLLACDTTSICRLARTSKTIAHCSVAGRVWEAVWRRQFGGIWELEDKTEPPISIPTRAAVVARMGPKYQRAPLPQLDARTAATKARAWLRRAAESRHSGQPPHEGIPADSWLPNSWDFAWLGIYDDRGHICYCPNTLRPFAVTVRTGFVDTPQFSSRMVMIATFRALNEAPESHRCFEVVWDGENAQKSAKGAFRVATRWADGVCEVDADGNSVHAKSGFSGASIGPAAPAAAAAVGVPVAAAVAAAPPTTGTWANWPDSQN